MPLNYTKARAKSPVEYDTWVRIRAACSNPKAPGFVTCGARGAKVHPAWNNFERFFADVGERPSPRHVFRRVDDAGDFEPGNTIWTVNRDRKYRDCDVRRKYHAEYHTWLEMRRRGLSRKFRGFKDYAGRGITLCEEWQNDFSKFLHHIGPRPSADHSVDRIDNDKGYEPGNVRWATRKEQNNNRRPRIGDGMMPKKRGTSSRYKGVYFNRNHQRWCAVFRKKYLGEFREEFDAATAYNFAAEEFYGPRGVYNMPGGC